MILALEEELDEWLADHGGVLPASVVIRDGWRRGRWVDAVVPYTFADDWDDPNTAHDDNACVRHVILQAMDEIAAVSAVRFVPRTDERDHVNFRSGDGCSSWIGRRGYQQHVNLAYEGPTQPDLRCAKTFIVVHEILHALGFLHEHTRDDRNENIDVLWSNIRMSMWSQYWRNPFAFDHGIYDFDSVMHYSDSAFCVRDANDDCIGPTMVAHDTSKTFGQPRDGCSKSCSASMTPR